MNIDVFQRVVSLMEMNKISYRTMASSIGMSYMGFYKAVQKRSLSVEHLMKVAEVLGVTMSHLFNEEPESSSSGPTKQRDVQLLKIKDNARDIQRIAAQLERDLSKLK